MESSSSSLQITISGTMKKNLLRDVFVTNLIDPEIQKELLKQTVQPRKALKLAINMEPGMRNQLQF